jgi:hypothetical protein
MSRQPKLFTIIGEPGCGKTERLIAHIRLRVTKNADRVIVIDPDGGEDKWNQFLRVDDINKLESNPNFKGVVVIPWEEGITFKLLRKWAESKKLTNYIMVLDDVNAYATPRPEDDMLYFLRRKRQAGVDVFTTAHSWMECAAAVCRFTDFWDIGPAGGSPIERQKEIGSVAVAKRLDKWQQMANQNNADAKRKGQYHAWFGVDKLGQHPKTGKAPA